MSEQPDRKWLAGLGVGDYVKIVDHSRRTHPIIITKLSFTNTSAGSEEDYRWIYAGGTIFSRFTGISKSRVTGYIAKPTDLEIDNHRRDRATRSADEIGVEISRSYASQMTTEQLEAMVDLIYMRKPAVWTTVKTLTSLK